MLTTTTPTASTIRNDDLIVVNGHVILVDYVIALVTDGLVRIVGTEASAHRSFLLDASDPVTIL